MKSTHILSYTQVFYQVFYKYEGVKMKKILSLLLVFSLATPVFASNPIRSSVPSNSPVNFTSSEVTKESLDISELKEHMKEDKANWATLKRRVMSHKLFKVFAPLGVAFVGVMLAVSFKPIDLLHGFLISISATRFFVS
jgi:hypothetical protein